MCYRWNHFVVCCALFFALSSVLAIAGFQRDLVEPLVDSPAKTIGSDFNGDGIHDIIMGAPLNSDGPGANDDGAAYILFGSGSFSATYDLEGAGVNVTILGKAAIDRLGWVARSAGDINSDGFDDVVVGAPLNNDGGTANSGAVYILYGSPNLSATYQTNGVGVDITLIGKVNEDQLGYRAASAGDINGDGFDDLMMSAPGNDDGGGLVPALSISFMEEPLSLPIMT